MKRIVVVLCVALTFAGLGSAAYRAAAPVTQPLSKFVPAGPLLYLEAKDFSSMLSDWKQLGLLTATFTAMLLTAKLFSKSEAKQERQPQSDLPLEAGQPANAARSAAA